MRSPPRSPKIIGADIERCFFCNGTDITRRGKRYKKHETIQLWHCHTCNRVFTPQHTKGKTYPHKLILEGLICESLVYWDERQMAAAISGEGCASIWTPLGTSLPSLSVICVILLLHRQNRVPPED